MIKKKSKNQSQRGDNNGIIISKDGQKEKSIRKHINKDNKLEFFCIYEKYKILYGYKKKYKLSYFWDWVSWNFVEYRGYFSYIIESCGRQMTNKVR